MSPATRISCEISAPRRPLAEAIARIARTCAQDVGQKISVSTHATPASDQRTTAPILTLHLPAELAASQHPVWCLACRLACFCPTARVSVLVHGENSFGAIPSAASGGRTRRHRSAS